ncbi:MAG: hypothetical protein EOO38_01690 [Cytophagaceae bacterium]|nr:MAG: hypothetical protein EOO38_01690 [Cytophagaceae bacterium]
MKREDLTETQVKAVRIADNKVSESYWLKDVLKAELADLSALNFDMELTGFPEVEALSLMHEAPPEAAEEHAHAVYKQEWQGMPEYEADDLRPKSQLIVSFATDEARQAFAQLVGQPNLGEKAKSIWYPQKPIDHVADIGYGEGP